MDKSIFLSVRYNFTIRIGVREVKKQSCNLIEFAKAMNITLCNKEIDFENIKILSKDINRPGLQIFGHMQHFDKRRVQIIGLTESNYLKGLSKNGRLKKLEKLLRIKVPCYIFCRNIAPMKDFLLLATKNNIPVFLSNQTTSEFMSASIQWLAEELAPTIIRHGCMVDINGVGVLIQGESGIGKSEAVLELIKRGHRMIADDAVEIKRLNEKLLKGSSPEILWEYMEIRGVGIVNIKTMFGVQAIKQSKI